MDEATRTKVASSMRTEGFTQPLVVRPNPTGRTPWQIIDGEHRWKISDEVFGKPALTEATNHIIPTRIAMRTDQFA